MAKSTLPGLISPGRGGGLNEHTNGLIRRFYPKGTDCNEVSDEDIARLERILNVRGRKSLGYHSPNEVFLTYLHAA